MLLVVALLSVAIGLKVVRDVIHGLLKKFGTPINALPWLMVMFDLGIWTAVLATLQLSLTIAADLFVYSAVHTTLALLEIFTLATTLLAWVAGTFADLAGASEGLSDW